jgi:hypothetical protein
MITILSSFLILAVLALVFVFLESEKSNQVSETVTIPVRVNEATPYPRLNRNFKRGR